MVLRALLHLRVHNQRSIQLLTLYYIAGSSLRTLGSKVALVISYNGYTFLWLYIPIAMELQQV